MTHPPKPASQPIPILNTIAMRTVTSTTSDLMYFLGDHLGSTSLTVTPEGSATAEMRYLPWGETRYSMGTTPTEYRYREASPERSAGDTGQRSESAIGLYYYNARWYDPALSRFIQADTIVPSGVQGLDRYAYVSNNPVRFTDSSGHCIDGVSTIVCIAIVVILLSSLTGCDSPPSVENPQILIDSTISKFEIETNGVQAVFDSSLEDNGSVSLVGGQYNNGILVSGTLQVNIGPYAFESSDQLTDTLVHEFFHVQQYKEGRWYNTTIGKWINEIEAYDYVITNKDLYDISENVVATDELIRDWYRKKLNDPNLSFRVDEGMYTIPTNFNEKYQQYR